MTPWFQFWINYSPLVYEVTDYGILSYWLRKSGKSLSSFKIFFAGITSSSTKPHHLFPFLLHVSFLLMCIAKFLNAIPEHFFFVEKLIYGRKKEHMASYLSLSARHNWADVIISSTLFLKSFCTPLPSVHHPCHEIISGGFTKECKVIIWRKSHEKPFQITRKPMPKKVMIEVLRKIFCVDSNYPIRSRYCTCHDSIAVVACASLWPDCINVFLFVFYLEAIRIFTRYESGAHQTVC